MSPCTSVISRVSSAVPTSVTRLMRNVTHLYAWANKVCCQAAQPESDHPGNFLDLAFQAIALAN
jgi:hypothetical protein